MNLYQYNTINIRMASEPRTNSRKARCNHCMKLLQPGEGVGYPSARYGGGTFYLCQGDAIVHDRIEFTRAETSTCLESIAATLAHLLDSQGGVDTDSFLGYVSLRNGASLVYGRIQQIVNASGMYRLEVAQAIDAALTDDAPATVEDATMTAELAAVHALTGIYKRFGELLWVGEWLRKWVMEIRQ